MRAIRMPDRPGIKASWVKSSRCTGQPPPDSCIELGAGEGEFMVGDTKTRRIDGAPLSFSSPGVMADLLAIERRRCDS